MITFALKVLDAARAGWVAGRAVMDGRTPVLVDDVLAAEDCVCPTPRVVVVHNRGTACGDVQHDWMWFPETECKSAAEVLDILAEEADRRDGVRRGPR